MITILIDGKTYKPTQYEHDTVGKSCKDMLDMGYLEEVKENKELPIISAIKDEIDRKIDEITKGKLKYEFYILSGYRYMSNFIDKLVTQPDKTHSILEKLREENPMITYIRSYKIREWIKTQEGDQIWIGDLLNLLTSIETHQQEEPEELSQEEHQLSFTRGQEIEVSQDGIRWVKRRFFCNHTTNERYIWCLFHKDDREEGLWEISTDHPKCRLWYRQFSRPIEELSSFVPLGDFFEGLQDSLRTARENNTIPYVVISQLITAVSILTNKE